MSKKLSRHQRKPRTPKASIVEIDVDGDAWLKTGKRAKRRLTRDEFFRLVERGGVSVTRASS